MQPLVMQEWLHVLPPCPEWPLPAQAQRSPARPLSQVRAAPGALLWQLCAQLAAFWGANQALCFWGREGCQLQPPSLKEESVCSAVALLLQSVPQSRGRERRPAELDLEPLSQ